MEVRVLKINEKEGLAEKAGRLIRKASANSVNEETSTVEVNILSTDVSLLTGLVVVVANIGTKGCKGTPRTEIWMCRDLSDKIVGKKILVGYDITVLSSELSSDRRKCGLKICLDAQSITYIDGGFLNIKINESSGKAHVEMFKSYEILSKGE
jgi:hypothetical protein